MSVNEQQVGGDHYKSQYQHWDWCVDINLGYLESAATKYVSRWQKKNGVQDLKKAVHYLAKAIESHIQGRYKNRSLFRELDVRSHDQAITKTTFFLKENSIDGPESSIIHLCAMWCCPDDLALAVAKIQDLIADATDPVEVAGVTTPGQAAAAAALATQRLAQRPVGQGAATSTSTGVAENQSDGMDSPFGYNAAEESHDDCISCDGWGYITNAEGYTRPCGCTSLYLEKKPNVV